MSVVPGTSSTTGSNSAQTTPSRGPDRAFPSQPSAAADRPAEPSPEQDSFQLPARKPPVFSLLWLAAIVLIGLSLPVLKGPERDLDHLANLLRFLGRFFPPDLSILPAIGGALAETAQIAVISTSIAAVIALPVALASARNISPGWLVAGLRQAQNIIRTVPSLIWALMAVAVVGANPLAGVIALSFYSLGYLGKFFADAFESAEISVLQALRAIGASPVQAFQFGLWPAARPLVWSHVLWMLEYNMRSAAIIGYVGAGGLGTQLHTYQEYYQWDRFCTVLLAILAVVTLLDWLGERIRRRLA